MRIRKKNKKLKRNTTNSTVFKISWTTTGKVINGEMNATVELGSNRGR